MRFNTLLGAFVQTQPRAEGGLLIRAGFLRPVMEGDFVEGVEATDALVAYFDHLPAMERLYPLLVGFVACCRYAWSPGSCDDRRVRRDLMALGMSEEGIEPRQLVASGHPRRPSAIPSTWPRPRTRQESSSPSENPLMARVDKLHIWPDLPWRAERALCRDLLEPKVYVEYGH
jgi:hypothetical protein